MDENELPERLSFTMSCMDGVIFSFEWRDGALWVIWNSDQPRMSAEPRRLEPDKSAWISFWSQAQVIGAWHWRPEYHPRDIVVLDGSWWTLDMANAGFHVKSAGFNAYPPDGRMEPSEAFKQLLRAFGELCNDERFVRCWYFGAC